MPLSVPRARLPLRRVVIIAVVSVTGACSFLAPTDDELMGGHQPAQPSGATSDAGSAGDEGGAAGQGEARGGSGSHQGGAANGAAGESGTSGAAGEPGLSGAAGEPGMSGAAGEPSSEVCDANHRDCNATLNDGCETDLTLDAHCGGCGAEFACGSDTRCLGQHCASISGCSDGTRDGFNPPTGFEAIAGCSANWPLASMLSARIGQPCGPSLLRDCKVPADACGAYWHVCGATTVGAAEVSDRLNAKDCNSKPGAFAIAVGDQSCACSPAGSGAACCGGNCVQQNGSCIYPKATAWYGVIASHVNACGNIESLAASANPHGVLCCRDAP